jgi:PAS domain S-box-containing protein
MEKGNPGEGSMNTLSIPIIAMAGVSLYVGFYHLLIYIRRRQNREDLMFAILCFAYVFYDTFSAGLYNSSSLLEGVRWQRAQFISLAVFVTAFLWFVADYTHHKPGIAIYAMSLFYLVAIVVQVVDRSAVTFPLDQPSIKHITLPYLQPVTFYEATLGPFTTVEGLMGIAASTYALFMSASYFRRGFKREAMPLIAAIGLMYAAGLHDTFVSNGVYNFIYLVEYAYMAVILMMASSLSITVVEAAIAREELRKSEERFRSLVETTSDWVWEVDANGVYTYASPRVQDLLGYQPEELIGRTPFELMAPDEAERLSAVFREHVLQKKPLERVENLTRRKNGELVILETSGVPFFDEDGQLLGYRGIDRDITDRKLNEAEREALIGNLEAKNAELERFTYTVSHDLKAPLITIRGFLGYVDRDVRAGDMDRLQEDMQRIITATDRLQRLLNELLELSRIGRLMNPPENIAFEALAQDAIKLMEGRLRERNVAVSVQADLPVVFGDCQRLLEVIQNLLDNAVKFMGKQVQPLIEIGSRGQEKDMPVLYVRDNGIGIAAEQHERIFGLFNKLDPSMEGTGVGLAIVKRIVEVHGGRIWVESEPGKGATFYFTLPSEQKLEGKR